MNDVTAGALNLDAEPVLSSWFPVSQTMIDVHARNTGDDDWLHTDVERALQGPTGGTIAQGFLLLSLFTALHTDAMPALPDDGSYLLNYGFDRVRFVRPVLAGRSVRARSVPSAIVEKPNGSRVLTLAVGLEVDDDDPRPAVVADWLFLAGNDG